MYITLWWYKQGLRGTQKLSSLKSLKVTHPPPSHHPKNTGMCHEIIRNGFLIKLYVVNRKERPNRSTNNRDMTKTANRDVVGEQGSK